MTRSLDRTSTLFDPGAVKRVLSLCAACLVLAPVARSGFEEETAAADRADAPAEWELLAEKGRADA